MNRSLSDFDYIIIGAGAAGCVLAKRLSTDPSARVALIEAGPSDLRFPVNLKTALPIGNILLLPHARYNWQHQFTGGSGVGGRSIPCPRGKLLGGCTSVNGSVYMRGHRNDYDDWAKLGNEGWGYADVLAAYKKHENRHGAPSEYHGTGGELDVNLPNSLNDLARAFVDAAVEVGHRRNDDFNGAVQDGFGPSELNQRNGVRMSSSRAFLHPVIHRPNLHVFADTLVERIDLSAGRAVGVTVVNQGQRRKLTASSEIVLSGGAVNSPQLLLLSGIGPAGQLRRHGIAVVQELPGVGRNLQDHPTSFVSRQNPSAESYALSLRSYPRLAWSPVPYLIARKGILASNVSEAAGFIRTVPGLDRPDVQMTLLVGLKGSAGAIPREHGYMVMVSLLRSRTRGYVELVSSRPEDKPVMHPCFLEDPADVATLVRGMREARKIVGASALERFSGDEIDPGSRLTSDAELEARIRAQLATVYHPAGTCKMGPASDPLAVVDARLRVHGIERLRVADASIMPNIVGGNTAAPAMMIGERAAEFIASRGPAQRADAQVKAPAAA